MSTSAVFIQLALLLMYGQVVYHPASASRTWSSELSSNSSNQTSSPSARALSTQASSSSYNQINKNILKPPWPTAAPKDSGKVCFIEDCGNSPNATKTVDQSGGSNGYVPDANLEKVCVLWNSSCVGNKHDARDDFFTNNTADTLRDNECFQNQPTDPSEPNRLAGCDKIESPERLLRFGQAKNWMRSPQCLNNATKWLTSQPVLAGLATLLPHGDHGAPYCCAKCDISVGNVDIYYWPELDVDTSCLNIIGNNSRDLDHGATTTSQEYAYVGRSSSTISYYTYWGCTGQDSSITTTAYITQVNSIKFKASSYNPWSSPPCSEDKSRPIAPKASNAARGERPPIRARAQSLIIQPNITQKQDLVSTVVVDNFTFTSPSIYANFHNIVGDDGCGKPVYVPETMLTFLPGELSTIAGPLTDCNIDYCSFSTKAYDFRDLPCPPQNVMEENWYKPQPGEPYRPLIAMPKQILHIRPYFSRCVDNFFTGFDPPRTLAPAAALAPSTTTTSSVASTTSPKPSPTPDAGAKKTNNQPPINAPSKIPTVGQQRKEDTQAPDPKHQTSNPGTESHDLAPPENHPAQPGSNSEKTNGDPQQGEKAKTILAEGKNPTPPFNPAPPITAGITKAVPNQNTHPASNDIPSLVGNADPVDVEPTDRHSQVQPNDPHHIGNAAQTVKDTGDNHRSEVNPSEVNPSEVSPSEVNPSEVNPFPGTRVDAEEAIPSHASPAADWIEKGLQNETPNKFDPSPKAVEDAENDDSSLNRVPGKSTPAEEITGESRNENLSSSAPSIQGLQYPGMETASEPDSTKEPGTENPSRPHSSFEITDDTRQNDPSNIDPSAEVMGGSKVENPSEANLPIKGAQDLATENTDESDPAHETMENPEEGAPSRPRPTGDVMEGNEKDPSNPYATVGGTGQGVPGELDTMDTVGDSNKEFTNNINPSFGTMGDVGKDHSSDLYSSVVHPGSENLSALGQLLDTTGDPEKAYLDDFDDPFETTGEPGKDISSDPNPSVNFPMKESHNSPDQSSTSTTHATITATTPIPASEKPRTALLVNGTLNPPSVSANVTIRSTAPSSPSHAGITAESGLDFPPPTRTDAPVSSNDYVNAASEVGVMNRRAWMALGVLMFWGI